MLNKCLIALLATLLLACDPGDIVDGAVDEVDDAPEKPSAIEFRTARR